MDLNFEEGDLGKRVTVFEDAWRKAEGRRKGKA